jgi:hypothetical protein
MEVHSHTHTERKKWTHYLWEFLMLFLAVTLGFFVENQREHLVENKREIVYINSFIEDLKLDTSQLNGLIESRKKRIKELDTLFQLLSSDQYMQEGASVYRLYSFPYWDILRFYPNDRTMQQLKNSGGLRLIRNQKVSDMIINYDVLVRNRKEYEPLQVDLANQMNKDIEKLIDPVLLHKINHRSDSVAQLAIFEELQIADTLIDIPQKITIPAIGEADKKTFLKNINTIKTLSLAYMRANLRERQLAVDALKLIKQEYHLE